MGVLVHRHQLANPRRGTRLAGIYNEGNPRRRRHLGIKRGTEEGDGVVPGAISKWYTKEDALVKSQEAVEGYLKAFPEDKELRKHKKGILDNTVEKIAVRPRAKAGEGPGAVRI